MNRKAQLGLIIWTFFCIIALVYALLPKHDFLWLIRSLNETGGPNSALAVGLFIVLFALGIWINYADQKQSRQSITDNQTLPVKPDYPFQDVPDVPYVCPSGASTAYGHGGTSLPSAYDRAGYTQVPDETGGLVSTTSACSHVWQDCYQDMAGGSSVSMVKTGNVCTQRGMSVPEPPGALTTHKQ